MREDRVIKCTLQHCSSASTLMPIQKQPFVREFTLQQPIECMISNVLMFYTQLLCIQYFHNCKQLCHTVGDTPLHYNMAQVLTWKYYMKLNSLYLLSWPELELHQSWILHWLSSKPAIFPSDASSWSPEWPWYQSFKLFSRLSMWISSMHPV